MSDRIEPQNESCPATRDARGIAPIPCALPLGHAGEHRSKGGTTWAEIVPPIESRQEYVESMVAYVKTHERYDELSKEDAMRELLGVMLGDIGAAQGFLQAIGVDVDLYA